jgi:hypothetical protein
MHELSAGIFATVPEKTSALRVAVVLSAVQNACQGLAASMEAIVAGVLRSVTLLSFALRDFASCGFVAIAACFACSCAAGLAAANFLTVVDDGEGARGLVASTTVLVEVALRVVRVRVRSPCGRAAMLAGFAACGVAAAAACVVGIVVDDEFFVARGGEGGVGKLSLVSFFWCPGWW